MTSLAWAAAAAVLAVTAEVLFRRGIGWPDHWWLFAPWGVGMNYLVFKMVSGGPSLIVAVAAFSLGTICCRALAAHFILGEEVSHGNLVAVVALFVAVIAGYLWR